jgi:hypothetical protein
MSTAADMSSADRRNRHLWMRVASMLLLVLAYGVAKVVLAAVILGQLATVAWTGRANTALLQLGRGLAIYAYQLVRYLTFNTDDRPFPFAAWPNADAPRLESDAP